MRYVAFLSPFTEHNQTSALIHVHRSSNPTFNPFNPPFLESDIILLWFSASITLPLLDHPSNTLQHRHLLQTETFQTLKTAHAQSSISKSLTLLSVLFEELLFGWYFIMIFNIFLSGDYVCWDGNGKGLVRGDGVVSGVGWMRGLGVLCVMDFKGSDWCEA